MTSSAEEETCFWKNRFDKEIKSLADQLIEIDESKYGSDYLNDQIEITCLNMYMAIYRKMDNPTEHYKFFEALFTENKCYILDVSRFEKWLEKENVYVQLGYGLKNFDLSKSKSYRIMLSKFYLNALELKKMAEGYLDIDPAMAKSKDLIRHRIILLHLYRLFYIVSVEDREILKGLIEELEKELGVKDKFLKPAKENTQTSTGLSSLFNLTTDIMRGMGHEPPANIKPPSDKEIGDMISNVFNNPKTQNVLSGLLGSMKGQTDFNSALQGTISNLTTPEAIEALTESVKTTANFANQCTENEKPQ